MTLPILTPGMVYGGWRISSKPVYGGVDFIGRAIVHYTKGGWICDMVRSERGAFYLRPHQDPHGTAYYNRWLYPIEPAAQEG